MHLFSVFTSRLPCQDDCRGVRFVIQWNAKGETVWLKCGSHKKWFLRTVAGLPSQTFDTARAVAIGYMCVLTFAVCWPTKRQPTFHFFQELSKSIKPC